MYRSTSSFLWHFGTWQQETSKLHWQIVLRCQQHLFADLLSGLQQQLLQLPPITYTFQQETEAIINDFFRIAQLPGVIGCIDGTHIKIKSPGGEDAERYRCRKGFMSLNVQAVSDAKLKFTNIVCSWPGSTHDARIF